MKQMLQVFLFAGLWQTHCKLSHHILVVTATSAAATTTTAAVQGIDLAEDRSVGNQLVVHDIPACRQEEERSESLNHCYKLNKCT